MRTCAKTIEFSTKAAGVFTIYNILGQQIAQEDLSGPGSYTMTWGGITDSGSPASSGVYIYVLETDDGNVQANKMVMLDGGRAGELEQHKTSGPINTANTAGDEGQGPGRSIQEDPE